MSNSRSSRTAHLVRRNERVVVIGLPPNMRQCVPLGVGKTCLCTRPNARIGRAHRSCSVDLMVRAASARSNATRPLQVARFFTPRHKHALPKTCSLKRLCCSIGRRFQMATAQSTATWSRISTSVSLCVVIAGCLRACRAWRWYAKLHCDRRVGRPSNMSP